MSALSAETLLAGSKATFRITVPRELLSPGGVSEAIAEDLVVVLRPLNLLDLQRIRKAAEDKELLTSVLMVKQALVEPELGVDQVNALHAGLVQFLLREVNRISGLSMSQDELEQTVQAPLARACFVLSREFGWTPEECANLSVGQVLLYLEMLGRQPAEA